MQCKQHSMLDGHIFRDAQAVCEGDGLYIISILPPVSILRFGLYNIGSHVSFTSPVSNIIAISLTSVYRTRVGRHRITYAICNVYIAAFN